MPDDLSIRVTVPQHVLFQEVTGSAALLNLESELYFGLDDVGTRMWRELATGRTIGEAATGLAAEYEAPVERIAADLIVLVRALESHGLVEINS
jgi:hypothetical protein